MGTPPNRPANRGADRQKCLISGSRGLWRRHSAHPGLARPARTASQPVPSRPVPFSTPSASGVSAFSLAACRARGGAIHSRAVPVRPVSSRPRHVLNGAHIGGAGVADMGLSTDAVVRNTRLESLQMVVGTHPPIAPTGSRLRCRRYRMTPTIWARKAPVGYRSNPERSGRSPMRAGAQYPRTCVCEQAVVGNGAPGISQLVRQRRCDPLPLRLVRFTPSAPHGRLRLTTCMPTNP